MFLILITCNLFGNLIFVYKRLLTFNLFQMLNLFKITNYSIFPATIKQRTFKNTVLLHQLFRKVDLFGKKKILCIVYYDKNIF